jgi:biopolymer transport protein TolR
MGRKFHRVHRPQPIAELNVTNLIDLGFMLLVIFMITSNLITQEQTIPVKLPVESKSAQPKANANTQYVPITIDIHGNYYVGNEHAPLGRAELRDRLASLASRAKQPVIRVRGDPGVDYQRIVTLLDELKQANLTQVTFDTQAQ